MKESKQSQDHQRQILYIIEENFNRPNKECIKKCLTELKNKKKITNGKCRDLVDRLNQGWVISDALSYSEDLNTIINAYKEIIKSNHWKRYRIVRAKCLFHVNYGISISDYDYKRTEILPMWKYDVCLWIRDVCSLILSSYLLGNRKIREKMILCRKQIIWTDELY